MQYVMFRKLLAFALAAGVCGSAGAAADLAMGLIVKLKEPDVTNREAKSLRLLPHRPVALRDRHELMMEAARRARVDFKWHRSTAFGAEVIHAGHPIPRAEAEKDAARLRRDSRVAWVIVNEMERTQSLSAPDDEGYAQQTWLHATTDPASPNIASAWARLSQWTLTDRADAPGVKNQLFPIVVAVLDTGVLRHPDLSGRVLFDAGYDFVRSPSYSNDGNGLDPDATDPGDFLTADQIARDPASYRLCSTPRNSTWHGTVIAGQLAARTDNAVGVAGMLRHVASPPILPVRIAGNCGAAVSDIIEGMMWAAGVTYPEMPKVNLHPARVLTLSFGGVSDSCTCTLTDGRPASAACLYQEAIKTITKRGAILVAASGNAKGLELPGQATPSRPANCPGVLPVTALNKDGGKAHYAFLASASGIATLGGDPKYNDTGIYSTSNSSLTSPVQGRDGESEAFYKAEAGTSFSAPIAAGAIAMMWAVNPGLGVSEILKGLKTHGVRKYPVSSTDPSPGGSDAAATETTSFPTVYRDGLPLPLCTGAETGACNCTNDTCGAGVLDVDKAVAWAMEQGPPRTYNPPAVDATFKSVPAEAATPRPKDGEKGGGGVISTELLWLAAGLLARRRWLQKQAAGEMQV